MASRIVRTVLVSALGLAAAAPGLAQPPSNEAAVSAPASRNRGARRARGRRAAQTVLVVSRPGFQMAADGSSRFLVQVSATPTWEMRTSRHRVELKVANARLSERNDREPLETRFFETPVVRMRLEPRGRDVYVVFELRSDTSPTVTVEPGANGTSQLVAVFGSGQFRTEGERRAVEEALHPSSVDVQITPAPQGSAPGSGAQATPAPAGAQASPPPAQGAAPVGYDEERPPAMNRR